MAEVIRMPRMSDPDGYTQEAKQLISMSDLDIMIQGGARSQADFEARGMLPAEAAAAVTLAKEANGTKAP